MARLSVEDRREALVLAALRVIDRDGVHAATTRAIVGEAGMALASFHYAFRSRDELIRGVIAHVIEGEKQAAFSGMVAGTDIRGLVRAGLGAYVSLMRNNPGHEQAVFELFHYSLRTPELGDLPRAQYASYRELASAVLELGATQAGITWSLPTEQLARFVVTLTDGITLAWLADRDEPATEQLLDLATDALVALVAEPGEHAADAAADPATEATLT